MWEDGSIEVQGLDFPLFPSGPTGADAKVITKMWGKWGPSFVAASKQNGVHPIHLASLCYIESQGNEKSAAACEPTYCGALWKEGLCASQGGPEKYCAGGLMAFTSQSAKMFGHTMTWYMENPDQMIIDAGHLLVMKIQSRKGDFLSGVKGYNGSGTCAANGPAAGIMNMYGQSDYLTKFIRTANALAKWNIASNIASLDSTRPPGSTVGPVGAAAGVGLILGLVGFMFIETTQGFPITNALFGVMERLKRDRSQTSRSYAHEFY